MTADTDAPALNPVATAPRRRQGSGLTLRLLGLAAGFVLLTEALIFVPSLGAFRDRWMAERFDTGELAVLAARTPDGNGFRKESAPELVRAADIVSVVMIEDGARKVLIGAPPGPDALRVDLERLTLGGSMRAVLAAMVGADDPVMVLSGRPRSNAAIRLEVAVESAPLSAALWRETGRVLAVTLALAILIGALIYASLAEGFVRPMRRLTLAIARFRDAPQDASRSLKPSGRADEIGEAEVAFADMQDALRQALLQRERLAQLGVAVSKISHDLRHSLATAQLVSERLASVDDPAVRAAAPRLERALERAAGLAESTLRYGRADERAPVPRDLVLSTFLDEVAEEALAATPGVRWRDATPEGLVAHVDPDHAQRIFSNLMRNAAQAMAKRAETAPDAPSDLIAQARRVGDRVLVTLRDTGPGLPARVRDRLFEPFAAGGLAGGTGLGLAIARDLARLNGGDVRLAGDGPGGATFEIALPARGEAGDTAS